MAGCNRSAPFVSFGAEPLSISYICLRCAPETEGERGQRYRIANTPWRQITGLVSLCPSTVHPRSISPWRAVLLLSSFCRPATIFICFCLVLFVLFFRFLGFDYLLRIVSMRELPASCRILSDRADLLTKDEIGRGNRPHSKESHQCEQGDGPESQLAENIVPPSARQSRCDQHGARGAAVVRPVSARRAAAPRHHRGRGWRLGPAGSRQEGSHRRRPAAQRPAHLAQPPAALCARRHCHALCRRQSVGFPPLPLPPLPLSSAPALCSGPLMAYGWQWALTTAEPSCLS